MFKSSEESSIIYEYSEEKNIKIFGGKKTIFTGMVHAVKNCILDTDLRLIVGKNFCYDYIQHQYISGSYITSCDSYKEIDSAGIIVCANYSNYFHWTLEAMYSIWLLKQASNKIFLAEHFPFPQSFHEESINSFDVSVHFERGRYKIKELLVPEFFIHPNSEDPKSGWQYVGYSKNYYKDLNKIFKSSHKEKSQFERLYLNRSNANFRKPSNLRLQNLMDELGYISTDFFGKKIKEQAEIINSANVIVAIHGAANSNFIFSKPDAQIVEIFSENYSPSNFEIITSDIGCNYRRVLCPASGCLDQPLKSDPHIDNNLIEFISIL